MNFSETGNVQNTMAQVKALREQIERKFAETLVEAQAGSGLVTIRMNGRKVVQRVKIDVSALGAAPFDIARLEDLIASAVNEAGRRADEAMNSGVLCMMGGENPPGRPA